MPTAVATSRLHIPYGDEHAPVRSRGCGFSNDFRMLEAITRSGGCRLRSYGERLREIDFKSFFILVALLFFFSLKALDCVIFSIGT